MEGGGKQGPGATPHGVRQDMEAALTPRRKGRLPVIGELTSGGLISYQGNQQRGKPLTTPLIRIITSWGLGLVVGRSVMGVGVGEAGPGRAGDGREQEHSHPEWPGHTLHPYVPCTALMVLVHSPSATSLGSGA